jgi:DNA-binding XRE family transcriptional regulator
MNMAMESETTVRNCQNIRNHVEEEDKMVFSNSDLKQWREERGMSAADLAERISVDTSTVYKIESGKQKANPDVMYQICLTLGDVSKWCSWMRTEYPASYGRIHPGTVKHGITGAIMALYAEMGDMQEIQRDLMRDAADGTIDDPELAAKLRKEVKDLIRSAQQVKNLLHREE